MDHSLNLRVDDAAILLLENLVEVLLEVLNKIRTLADVLDVVVVDGLRNVGGFILGVIPSLF